MISNVTDKERSPDSPRRREDVAKTVQRRWWLAIVVSALLIRLTARLYSGEADFWQNGYGILFEFARNIAAGRGLALDGQPPTAYRVPLYPLFLVAVTFGRRAFLPIVMAEAFIGAATVFFVGRLAAELFGERVAFLAAILAAFYPYYIVHDTALQDTSLFTLLTLVSVFLLIRARRSMSDRWSALAGATLAADALTRATILPFAVLSPLWLALADEGDTRRRIRSAVLCATMFVVGVAPWMLRSFRITGAAVLQSDSGLRLWDGNNLYTFSHYPFESIDRSRDAALEQLSSADRAELQALGSDEISVDRWYRRRAAAFITENPARFVENGFRKIGAAVSWLPSPRRSFWPTLVYALSYGPIMALGLLGMAWRWRCWRDDLPIWSLFIFFAVTTAVFFGHTSHRAFLDVYWMIYASSVIVFTNER